MANLLSAGKIFEIYFFDDPVAEAQVHRIADVFGLQLVELYFERIERDLN